MLPDAAVPAVLSEAGYIYRQVDDHRIDFLLWVILAATWANSVAALQTHIDACHRIIASTNVSDTRYNFILPIYSLIASMILWRAFPVNLSNWLMSESRTWALKVSIWYNNSLSCFIILDTFMCSLRNFSHSCCASYYNREIMQTSTI